MVQIFMDALDLANEVGSIIFPVTMMDELIERVDYYDGEIDL